MFLFIGERSEHAHPEWVRTGCLMRPNFKALNSVTLEDLLFIGERSEPTHSEWVRPGGPIRPNFKALYSVTL